MQLVPTGPVTPAELERLVKFSEECSEGIQIAQKIILHGFVASDEKHGGKVYDNRRHLEKEIGDILTSTKLLVAAKDVNPDTINERVDKKTPKITNRMYHQAADVMAGTYIHIAKV